MQLNMSEHSHMAVKPQMSDWSHMEKPSEPSPMWLALMRIKPTNLSRNAWTQRAGVSRSFFTDVAKHGNPDREKLIKVLEAVDWTIERFEIESGLYLVKTEVRGVGAVGRKELSSLVFGNEPLPPLPLYGSAQGGELDGNFELTELNLHDVLDYLQRPVSLADDRESYALTIVGDSMVPRFKPGERVGVSPRSRVEIGDDVIVQLRDVGNDRVQRVLIKELVRRKADVVVLRQYNPSCELSIERSRIVSMHKVRGHFL